MRMLRILPWALLAVHWLFAVGTYSALPMDIPTNLDLAGAVTGTSTKTPFAWFMLPGVATGVLGMLTGLRLVLPSRPQLFNFPDKDRFLRLPTAYRGPVIAAMGMTLDLAAALVMATMTVVQVGLWQAADGAPRHLMPLVTTIMGILIGPAILLTVGRVSRAVDEAERRWRDDEQRGRDRA